MFLMLVNVRYYFDKYGVILVNASLTWLSIYEIKCYYNGNYDVFKP